MHAPPFILPSMHSNSSLNVLGHLIIASSLFFFALAGYAVLFSAFLPLSGIFALDILVIDAHYKYALILLIPTTSYFVIANWVGWEYYRNS